MIDRQVTHLVRLVDDLLDVSRITRGKIDLRQEPVDLAGIVESAVEAHGPSSTRVGTAWKFPCLLSPWLSWPTRRAWRRSS